jgi:protein TonB
MLIIDETIALNVDAAGAPRPNFTAEPDSDAVLPQAAMIAMMPPPDVRRARPGRWRWWSWSASLCVHGLVLLAACISTACHWLALPMESGPTVLCLEASLSVEPQAVPVRAQVEIQPPAELAPQPVTLTQLQLEQIQEPTVFDIVVEELQVAEPAAMPQRNTPSTAQDLPPPVTRELLPRSALAEVPEIATVAVTLPVTPRAATTANAPPRVVYNPPPVYPAAQLAARITGRVVFLVVINAQGRVASLVVEQSSGSDALDQAARQAVLQWQFEPAGGSSVSEREIRIPISFRIGRGG